MFLIDTATHALRSFPSSDQCYAILSHTWGPVEDEVTYEDMILPERSEATLAKPGYAKIIKTCEIARQEHNLPYAWIDTCCIDKASSAELSEAINSMFRWYKDASICFAYLSDVTKSTLSFHQSRWFTRGWTLQELIAPQQLFFFDGDWEFLGTKESLVTEISGITGIPGRILNHSMELSGVPVAQRFSWASTRETTRVEDHAYSLLGIFDINMGMLYGEGTKAFIRLQEQILSQSVDMSIFLWTGLQPSQEYTGLLALSPACFREMTSVVSQPPFTQSEFYLTNRGIRLKLDLAWDEDTGLAILPLEHSRGKTNDSVGVYLRRVGPDSFVRAAPQELATVRTQRNHKVFTAVKVLTAPQSNLIMSNALRIQITVPTIRRLNVVKVEPYGSWDQSTGLVHTSQTGAFMGYIVLQEDDWYNPFAVVFCFKNLHWSAAVVEGLKWAHIQGQFYTYYKDNIGELKYDDRMDDVEMARIHFSGKPLTVHMRGGSSSQPGYIEIAWPE